MCGRHRGASSNCQTDGGAGYSDNNDGHDGDPVPVAVMVCHVDLNVLKVGWRYDR